MAAELAGEALHFTLPLDRVQAIFDAQGDERHAAVVDQELAGLQESLRKLAAERLAQIARTDPALHRHIVMLQSQSDAGLRDYVEVRLADFASLASDQRPTTRSSSASCSAPCRRRSWCRRRRR